MPADISASVKPASYAPKEAARLLGCSTMTVYRRCADGSIPSFKLGPDKRSMIRIPAAFIDRLLAGGAA